MSQALKMLVAGIASLSVVACSDTHQRMSEIAAKTQQLCDAGAVRAPAAAVFERERRVCYAYRTVNDGFIHWTDISMIRGEGRFGATFSAETTWITTPNLTLQFFDQQQYECVATERLVMERDPAEEALSDTPCYWRVGTPAQVEHDLEISRIRLEARLHPRPPPPPRPPVPRLLPLSP